MQSLGYDPASAEQLEASRQSELSGVRAAKETVEALSAQLAGVDFSYRDPERGWDRSRVKGVSDDRGLACNVCVGWMAGCRVVVMCLPDCEIYGHTATYMQLDVRCIL